MAEPSCQHLPHAGVIIRSRYGLDSELPVIAALGLSFFKHHHGAYIGKAADVTDIEGFHTHDTGQSQQIRNFFHGTGGAAFLSGNPFLILGKNQGGVLCCQLH